MAKPRRRKTKSTSPKVELGDSWVVDNEYEDEYRPEESSDGVTSSQEVQSKSRANPSTPKPPATVKPVRRKSALAKEGADGGTSSEESSSDEIQKASTKALDSLPTSAKSIQQEALLPKRPQRRTTRSNTPAAPEPELIYPSIHEDDSLGPQTNMRKRKVIMKQSPKPQKANGSSVQAQEIHPPQETPSDIPQNLELFLKSFFGHLWDMIGRVFSILKTPISYLIAIYLLFGLFIITRNILFNSLYSALSPLCRIPGSSLLNLPMCKSSMMVNYKGDETPPVEFDQLMGVQSKFEQIMEETAHGISLPLDMKRSEASIRDLREVVRFSQLHSKNELVLEFDGFIATARTATSDLQRFNSHVGRSVDHVLSTARWTTRVLEGIADQRSARGAAQAFIEDKVLAPFQPLKFTENKLLAQYIEHTQTVEAEIHRLLVEAQALLQVLQNLEDRLDFIHGITIRDNNQAQYSREEVLAQLWTKFGGNRSNLARFDSELKLLQRVNSYRQNAFAYVASTIVKLQTMQAELEELRARVGMPELLKGKQDVPLSVHIENILLGVERLEVGREKTKMLQKQYIDERLGAVDEILGDGGRREIGGGKVVDLGTFR